jgi:hypothetical protein
VKELSVADREQVIRALRDQLEAAQERRRKAAADLESVAEAAGSAGSSSEDLERLLRATREYSAADADVTNALLRLNYVLGLRNPAPPLRPSNNHEVSIAGLVDDLSKEGRLDPAAIDQIIAALDFVMSRSETDFLVNYIRWRIDNPVGE